MTDFNHPDDEKPRLNWARIGGQAFAIAVHVALFMMLIMPIAPPDPEAEEERSSK